MIEGSVNLKYPVTNRRQYMKVSSKLLIAFLFFSFLMIPVYSIAESFTARHVDDGDTIICENRDITIRVRLAGINAPEIGKNNKDDGQPFSREAKLVLEKLVLDKVVDIKGYGLDDYNRVLAVVSSGGKNINLEMIRQGMAEVYKGSPPKGFNTDLYRKAEKEAKESLRGIWSQGDKYESPSQWRRTNREN
jgi:micrococcal nuclease